MGVDTGNQGTGGSPNRRIYLIYPPISKQERYSSDIGASGGNQIPLGVFYLASWLRQQGHEIAVVDGEAENLTAEEIAGRVAGFAPDLIGISSTTVAFHRALELAAILRQGHPRVPLVLGGPHVSSNAEHAMGFTEFDYGVLGEGEITLAELVERIANGTPVHDLPGLAFRENNEVRINPPRDPIVDLDELPFPAFDLIPDIGRYAPPPCNYKRLPVVNVITARGCPHQCTFCDRNVFGRRLRQRSAENVAAEIEYLVKHFGVREIAFVDDTFTIGKERIRKIFTLLQEKGIRLWWTCMGHINTVDRELLEFMRDQGCWHISFGIESGNAGILQRIKKTISLDQVRQVIGWCAELGIRTKGFFIVGHPGETEGTIEETIRYALELPLDDIVATINTPIPGSPQYAEAHEHGSLDKTDWSKFNYWRPVFVPTGLTREVLLARHQEFYRRFYLRPRILWRYFLSLFSSGGLRRLRALARSSLFLFR